MKMNQLAKRIASELIPDHEGDLFLMLSREKGVPKDRGLRRTTIEELEKLHGNMSRWIPNDFDFFLGFGHGEFRAELIFDGGPISKATMEFPFPFDVRLRANLGSVDWDDLRTSAITGLERNDRIIEERGLHKNGVLITENNETTHYLHP
jgi:hypothetical protein